MNNKSSDETYMQLISCLLYTSDAADERSSVDLGGRRIIKKKNKQERTEQRTTLRTMPINRAKKTQRRRE